MSELEGSCNSLNKKISTLSDKINYLEEQIPLRKDSIRQIFSEGREDIDVHLENDFDNLEKTFNKKESEFNNRKLIIKVWDRNPNIDSYLGNYMGCCISVENKATIFDYLTDLGFQIVEMVDQKTKLPVVAAWCWLGKDEKDKPYLVIDNIEANPDYSKKFPKLMWKEIISYIRKYAKEIRADIVMGSSYNDLEPEDVKEYEKLIEKGPHIDKIGGFNGGKYYMDYQ